MRLFTDYPYRTQIQHTLPKWVISYSIISYVNFLVSLTMTIQVTRADISNVKITASENHTPIVGLRRGDDNLGNNLIQCILMARAFSIVTRTEYIYSPLGNLFKGGIRLAPPQATFNYNPNHSRILYRSE